MEAYCVKCKIKREMTETDPFFTTTGTPATRGICPVCGTRLTRMGRTEAHKDLPPPDPEARKKLRSGRLVIVESPAKARTVGRFLGKDYTVKASVGHVRDLLRSQLSVDVDNNFTPKYRVPNEKKPVVKELKTLARSAAEIYLATDPDREGEAIAWHLLESAEIDPKLTQRVVFHEITEPAIAEAFQHSRQINMDLVDAQQARRVLDRLVGYSISPLLWRKVRSRLSAGRVQSVALRLIVEREREIDAFIPVEYWSIEAEFKPEGASNPSSPSWLKSMTLTLCWVMKRMSSRCWLKWSKPRTRSLRSNEANGGGIRPRLSSPAACSRRRPAGWATLPGGRWRLLSSSMKGSIPVKAAQLA